MVEEIKSTLSKLNGSGSMPQKSTISGVFIILQQLSDKLMNVGVGDFINNLSSLTYGKIIDDYSLIVVGIILLIFNEDKFTDLIKRKY